MIRLVLATAAACLLANGAFAQSSTRSAGDWLVRTGPYVVAPKSDNLSLGPGATVEVDDGYSLGITGAYFLTDHIAVELLASLPFNHDIELNGAKVGKTRHLPPTLSVQWHFNPIGRIHPYLGAGLNWTIFFDEKTSGALSGGDLELDDSFGIAAQIGTDIDVGETMFLNLDLRWADIDTDAKLNGADLGEVEIDPIVVGLNVGWKF